MISEINKTGFYLDLDTLLDTRLSTVLSLTNTDEQKFKIIRDWPTREVDSFSHCSYLEFNEEFKKRNKTVLLKSSVTNASDMISEFVKETLTSNTSEPQKSKPAIYLNTYPYNLDENEHAVLLAVLRRITADISDIAFISKAPNELTPTWFKSKVAIALYYNPFEWLEIHAASGSLKERACPEVTMYSPKLYHRERLQVEDDTDVFAQSLLYIKPFVNLNFVKPSVFSSKLGLRKQ